MAVPIANHENEEDQRGKVFLWAKDKRIWMHVLAFLAFSILIHGSGFYLFQVVYPAPVRVEPEPESIQLLDRSNPEVRAILQRVNDRTAFLKVPSEGTDARVRIEDHPVRFTPAFQRTEIPLVEPEFSWIPPGKLDPLPLSEMTKVGGRTRVNLIPGEALRNRSLAPWSLMREYFQLAETLPHLRIELEVSPEGIPTVLEVDAELEAGAREELKQLVESLLRFVPGEDTDKGWIEVSAGS